MRGTDWMRIVLCGCVAGVVSYLVSVVFLSFLAPDFVTSVRQGAPYSDWDGAFFFGVDVAMASLVAAVVASLVGARLYDKVDRPAAREPATT